jgi:hypothetical protein
MAQTHKNMNALDTLEALTDISASLWAARELRINDNGNDDIAMGLCSVATYVGDAAQTLSNMQAKMAGHYALHDAITGRA